MPDLSAYIVRASDGAPAGHAEGVPRTRFLPPLQRYVRALCVYMLLTIMRRCVGLNISMMGPDTA